MKLSERECDIIACTAFRADLSVSEIAAETGYRPHVVRHILQRLRAEGRIVLRPFINPFAFGFTEYQALITIRSPGEEVRQVLLKAFAGSPYTTFIGEIGGEYHISVMFLAKTPMQITRYFEEVAHAAPNIDFDKTVFPCLEVRFYKPKVFSKKRFSLMSLSYGPVEQVSQIDEIDHAILSALTLGDANSKADVARRVRVAATTLGHRLSTLKERGILLGIGHVVPAYSDGLTAFALNITAKRPSAEFRGLIHMLAERHPSVSYLIRTLASWDFELGLRLPDPCSITSITHEFSRVLEKHVAKIDVIPVYRLVKLDPYPLKNLKNPVTEKIAVGA